MRAMIIILLLSGCASADLYTNAAIKAIQDAKDIEAKVLLTGPCLIGLGALGRVATSAQINAISNLCPSTGITAEKLGRNPPSESNETE